MKNRTVLITGAAGGIGSAIALKLAEQGYDIVVSKKYELKFPKGTDPDIISYLSWLCREVTEDPDFAAVLAASYAEPYYRDAATMNEEDPAEVLRLREYLH